MDMNQIIGKYVEYRDYVKAQQDALDEKLKPYKEAMATIETALNQHLLQTNQESAKTESGTAYVSNVMSTKVESREALMEYVRDNRAFDLLSAAVSKEAVKEHMDAKGGYPPPGVNVAFIRKINVRRS